VASIFVTRAVVATKRGDFERALCWADMANSQPRTVPKVDNFMFVDNYLGSVYLDCGEYEKAGCAYARGLGIAYAGRRAFHIQRILLGLAKVRRAQGAIEESARCLIAAEKLNSRIHSALREAVREELLSVKSELYAKAGSAVFAELDSLSWERIVDEVIS
jgi:tetratricopeptide (TPR) repeat protein